MGEETNPFFKPIFDDGREAGFKEGFAIGLAEARAERVIAILRRGLVRILRRRFREKAEQAVELVEALKTTLPDMEALIDEAAVAPTVDDFLRRIPSRTK